MNSIEQKMVSLLGEMIRKYDVIALKAEFEAEGTRIDEMKRLKHVASTAGLGLIVKIGGGEAITDMFEARLIGATTIIAPMIESSYALSKYLGAIEKHFAPDERADMHFGFNLETFQGYKNFASMLKLPKARLINVVTVGRVDLSASLGFTRTQIYSPKMNEIVETIFRRAKAKGLMTTMGGGMDENSIPFIEQCVKKHLLDRFETRKIVFNANQRGLFINEGIRKANEFELLWLMNKKRYYSEIIIEDEKRIEMLK